MPEGNSVGGVITFAIRPAVDQCPRHGADHVVATFSDDSSNSAHRQCFAPLCLKVGMRKKHPSLKSKNRKILRGASRSRPTCRPWAEITRTYISGGRFAKSDQSCLMLRCPQLLPVVLAKALFTDVTKALEVCFSAVDCPSLVPFMNRTNRAGRFLFPPQVASILPLQSRASVPSRKVSL